MGWLKKHIGLFKHLGDFGFKQWLDKNAEEVLKELSIKNGQTVLDVGCGSGTYTIPVARLVGSKGRVYALDVNRKALDKMERKSQSEGLKNIVRIDSSGEVKIPLKDITLDHVLLIDVLQEIDDKEALISEAHRVLKKKGMLSVYPMHMSKESIIKLTTSKGFILVDRKFDENILIFKKTHR